MRLNQTQNSPNQIFKIFSYWTKRIADTMVAEGEHRANPFMIQNQMPKSCQSLLFPATFPNEVVTFAKKMIVRNHDMILIKDGREILILDVITQIWVDAREYDGGKISFLSNIYSLLTI